MYKSDKILFVEKERARKGKEEKCPLIKRPLENCHCTSLRSHSVEKTLYYCASHYKECKIYKKIRKGQNEST